METEPTGFCWRCGRGVVDGRALFCDNAGKRQRAYERAKAAQENRVIRRGKRAGYGIGGSTS